MEFLTSGFKQLASFYEALTPVKKAALVFVSVLVVTVIGVMGMWAKEGEYVVLWRGMEPSEIRDVELNLAGRKIPYKIEDGGTTILVPGAKASQLRMDLTSSGITHGGKIVGFEIFDRKSLGTTSYVQKINYRRALEGELIKSIKSIKGVEEARVHLVMPENKTFLVDQKKATASVVLKTSPGKILSTNVILGISNLVASSVEGLESEDVSVLSSSGHLLSNNINDPLAKESNEQFGYKVKYERDLEKRAKEMLGRVAGHENVEVKVSADIDFTKEKFVQEQYDPDGAVLLSQVTMNEKFEGNKANPGGIPGARTNLPDGQNNVEQSGTNHTSDRNTETVNYNVSKKVINTVKPAAIVKKLSVSVLVNSEPSVGADGKVESYTKRKDLKELEVLAKNAIGFNDERGDAFSIESLPFKIESFDKADSYLKDFTKNKMIRDLVWFGLVGATILLFFFFIIRPFLNWVVDKTSETEELPASVEELESGAALATLKERSLVRLDDTFNPDKAESEALIEKIRSLVSKNPAKAVGALKPWINNEKK